MRNSCALAAALAVLCPADSSAASPDFAEEAAKAEFKRGQTAYTLGRFQEALGAYSKAYELKPLPPFLFNLAQCHRQLGDFERAVFFYQRYLEATSPEDEHAAMVSSLLEEAQRELAEQKRRAAAEAEARRQTELERAKEAAARAVIEAARLASAGPDAGVARGPPAGGLASSAQAAARSGPPTAAEPPIYERWWLWTAVGVVVAGAAAGTAAYLATEPKPFPTTLGTYDAR